MKTKEPLMIIALILLVIIVLCVLGCAILGRWELVVGSVVIIGIFSILIGGNGVLE